jgi:hypothetical protein
VLTVARFPVSRRRGCGQVGDRRRCSEGSWSTAMTRRCSACREELDGDDDQLDCFQKREMRSAGDVQGGRGFGFTMPCLISCERNCPEGMRRCARAEEMEWARRGSSWFTVGVGIVLAQRQCCGSPARDFASLAALFREKVEGEVRGGGDHLIGAVRDRNGQGV